MFCALLGLCAALAAPPAVLTPSGPSWLGPFLPSSLHDGGAPWLDLVVVVSPDDGRLYVQERDTPDTLRVWDGIEWTVDDAPVTEDWPERRDLSYQLEDGRLVSVAGVGGARRFEYDASGRLVVVRWPDGSQLRVTYDATGQVRRLLGPGVSQWSYDWAPDGLRITDPLGRQSIVRRQVSSSGTRVAFQDPLGRVARSEFDPDGRLVSAEDPRGLVMRVTHTGAVTRIEDGFARSWTLYKDSRGLLQRLESPGMGSWEWDWDGQGRLERVLDPTGRVTRWERDRSGRVVMENRSGAVTRYSRDTEGKISAITLPSGEVIRLARDTSGYVTSITDPGGNRYLIERYSGGFPMSITDPVGGRWFVGLDLQGRPDLIEDPTQRTLAIQRSPSGRVSAYEDSRTGVTVLKRGISGALNGIQAPGGEVWLLVRDMLDRVMQVERPDGAAFRIYRDILGEISGLEGGERIPIRRDSRGRPLEAGALQWEWAGSGLQRMRDARLDVSFTRDAMGRLEAMQAGDIWVRYSRDYGGRVIAWEGSEGLITVQRNPSGQVVSEQSPGRTELRLSYRPAGSLERITIGEQAWRWMVDAAGRVLRVLGPHQLSLGFVRDDAGRITLSRLPSGALLLRRWIEASVLERIEDAGGVRVQEQLTAFDHWGRIVQQRGVVGGLQERQYAPSGELIAIMTEQGPIYARTPESGFGPGEAMVVYDRAGRLIEARPAGRLPDWGVATELLSAFWEPSGALTELVGDQGVLRLSYDALGRLSRIEDLERGRWQISYDVRGRILEIVPPDDVPVPFRWSPSGVLLQIGDQSYVDGTMGGALLWGTAAGTSARVWLHGGFHWQDGASPMTWPRLTSSGHVAVFEGGPLIGPEGALEPITMQPLVQSAAPIWAPEASGRAALSPDPLMPTTSWNDPLSLSRRLGVIGSLSEETWAACPHRPSLSAPDWPQPSTRAPLGPSPGDLPLQEDPFTLALVCSLMHGTEPIDAGFFTQVVMAQEAEPVSIPMGLVQAPDGILMRRNF